MIMSLFGGLASPQFCARFGPGKSRDIIILSIKIPHVVTKTGLISGQTNEWRFSVESLLFESASTTQIGFLDCDLHRCNMMSLIVPCRVDFLKGRISFQPLKGYTVSYAVGTTFGKVEFLTFQSQVNSLRSCCFPFPQISWRFFEDLGAAFRNPPKSRPLTLAQNLGREIWWHRSEHMETAGSAPICVTWLRRAAHHSPLTFFFVLPGASVGTIALHTKSGRRYVEICIWGVKGEYMHIEIHRCRWEGVISNLV